MYDTAASNSIHAVTNPSTGENVEDVIPRVSVSTEKDDSKIIITITLDFEKTWQ
jgi:hypothetical protein